MMDSTPFVTNHDDDVQDIIAINKRRQIEECFRILKSDFDARPVYLRDDDRIKAHFSYLFHGLIILPNSRKQTRI